MDHHSTRTSRRAFIGQSARTLGVAAAGGPLLLRGSASATEANDKLNLALVGCGGQGRGVMGWMLGTGNVNLVALCDPDAAQIAQARSAAGSVGPAAKAYEDYRRLLDDAKAFDAVLIGTPDHWHVPLCMAFMNAGKHVYCEKPLAHSIAEARELRMLTRRSKVATQMGNQGSASESLRRCVEIIKAGALGAIRDIYYWGIGVNASEGRPDGEDAIPNGFNWDLWVGPSPMRPFKAGVYHPASWRGWFDFGNGGMADFCCHAMNLPMRALDLTYPARLVVNLVDGKQAPGKAVVEFHFGARGAMPPVVFHWLAGEAPPADVVRPFAELFGGKAPDGVLMVGEKGSIHTSHWNTDALIHLNGDAAPKRLGDHDATREIPRTLPRTQGHVQEWIAACRGEGATFSAFEIGGKLTEIGLAGVVALRAGKTLEWDGERMLAKNAPEAGRFIRTRHRRTWLM
jgi:predicted dehydrogenase